MTQQPVDGPVLKQRTHSTQSNSNNFHFSIILPYMAMYKNGLYTSEFSNIISYLCMSPPCHENYIFLDATAQNRVSFLDDGLIICI
jgi:hypothetical protein